MSDPRQPDITQAIYDGIRGLFPVDLTQYMGEKRAREYAALWANAATKRLLDGVLSEPAELLPGMFLAPDGGDCPTIWAEGQIGITTDPDPLLTRTEANARLFDAIAALLPDRTDEEADEDPGPYVECDDCEGRGVNCLAHSRSAQDRRSNLTEPKG